MTKSKLSARERTAALVEDTAERLIALMEEGEPGTWLRPWLSNGADVFNPLNAVTGGRYTGFNPIRLAIDSLDKNYSSHRWATYKQWASIGAQVRRGEHGTECVRWISTTKTEEKNGEEKKKKTITFPKVFTLFSAEQVDGYEIPLPERTWDPVERAEAFFAAQGATVIEGGDKAAYAPVIDNIYIPLPQQFDSPSAYYSVLAHEHVHWTGAANRCGRDLKGRFGDESYAVEELIAELGAASLCSYLGLDLEPRPDHAQYLAHWIKVLKDDPQAVYKVVADAGRAVDLLITTYEASLESAEAVAA